MTMEDQVPREFEISFVINRWPGDEFSSEGNVKRDVLGWSQPEDSVDPRGPTFDEDRFMRMSVREFKAMRRMVNKAKELLDDIERRI